MTQGERGTWLRRQTGKAQKGEAWIAIILKTRLISAAALTKLSFSTLWRRFLDGGAFLGKLDATKISSLLI